MAHLWVEENGGRWAIAALDGDRFALTFDEDGPVRRVDAAAAGCGAPPDASALLLRPAAGGEDAWILVAAPAAGLRVNGLPVAGLKRLADRDEVRASNRGRVYFSTERRATVEPFPGADRVVACSRCKAMIEAGTPAVRCPACGVWHHEDGNRGRPCWTYGELCAACPCSTEIRSDFRWSPDGL